MSSLISDMETITEKKTGTKHKRLNAWVEEVAQLCQPERVHYCHKRSLIQHIDHM